MIFVWKVDALNWYCDIMGDSDDGATVGGSDWKMKELQAVKMALGDEWPVLASIAPNLTSVLGGEPVEASSLAVRLLTDNSLWNRLRYVFLNFLRAISFQQRPVILFLDDLQWADEPTLDLITDLASDASLRNFMFIGAFRSNEVSEGHPLSKRISSIAESRTMPTIHLSNLCENAINSFIADTLRLDFKETISLTEVVYKKTQGNIFFTRHTLEELQRENALYLSMTTFRWTWEMQKVETVAYVSDNVVDIITAKISTLPEDVQRALSIASLMRSTFDIDTLHKLMKSEGSSYETGELMKMLEIAVFEGLLQNSVGMKNYTFAHDRIKQASSSLLPQHEDERDAMFVRVAKCLLACYNSEDGHDWMIFSAADHFNRVKHHDLHPLELAKLNLQVGEKAVLMSAFVPASVYLSKGVDALSYLGSPWELHYDVTLPLFSLAANVEACLGNFERSYVLNQHIIENAKSIHDKLDANLSLAQALGRESRHTEAMDIHIKSLQEIRTFPKRLYLAHALADILKVRNWMNAHSDYDILLLPELKDEIKLNAMEHLEALIIRSCYCNSMSVMLLCVARQIRLTIRDGVCPEAALAFVAFGMFLSSHFGDTVGGSRMGNIARKILEQFKSKDRKKVKAKESAVLSNTAIYIDAWSVPIPQILEAFRNAHKSGMESGDFEQGYRSWAACNLHAFIAGFPLHHIEESGAKLVQQMKHYRVDAILDMYEPVRFTVLQLMGKSAAPIDWSELDSAPSTLPPSSDTFRWIFFYWSRLQLAYYFGDLEMADRIAKPYWTVSENDKSYSNNSVGLLFSGLTASGLAKKTGKTKYKTEAKRKTAEMQSLMRTRGLNNLHRYLLMKADLLACDAICKSKRKQGMWKQSRPERAFSASNTEEVKRAFDRAISAAGKAGFRQDAALGSELAGEFFLAAGDFFWSKNYFTRSLELYKDWGARAKVDQLRERRGMYIDESKIGSSRSTMSSNLREFFSGDNTKIHNTIDFMLMSSKSSSAGDSKQARLPFMAGDSASEVTSTSAESPMSWVTPAAALSPHRQLPTLAERRNRLLIIASRSKNK